MTSPTETREAVARTIHKAHQGRLPTYPALADAIIADHLAPRDAEIESLRARAEAAEAALAESERQGTVMRGALALALRFVDRAAGEGLVLSEGDHGEPEQDAADVCFAVAHVLEIEDLNSDEFRALTLKEPTHEH